ncbi:MAG TPA: SpoIIE family protein phosphatase, partial [Flavobacteriales bacterium]|nr:SpoIIE family protein phosphatase [Flavobacteriales bacterium]
AESYNNIASVYTDLGDTASALTFLKKSRVYYTKINDWGGVAYNCLNMSKIYSAQKRDDLALELLEESKKILEKKPHLKSALANCLNFIGSIYKREGKEKEAKNYLLTALKIRLAIDDHSGIANSYVTLSDFYTETNKPDSAFYCAKQGMEYAQKSRNPETISRSAFTYSNALKARRNFEESLTYYDLYIRMRDSVNNGKTQKAMVKNQFKYQYENKAATDSLKHAEENIIKEERLAREKFQNIVLYIGLAVLILFIIYGYSRFKIIRQQKATIEQQKQIVDVKNKEMLDSMHYAKEIQNALLPSANMLNEMFAEHFILFKPKDIVSGDFYWSAKRGDEFYLAVCDSTGHGVPGAFMSLLNISFLNEAVIEKEMGKPSDALNYIRKRLIENVSRNGGQDGMDGTLAHFDRKNMKLRYASAHNKPLLIRKGEAQELPADKMPIGKGVIRQSFTQHEVDLQTGDIVYFYSDGYADQFGGPKGKKFKSSNLNSLLVRVSKFSLSEQNAKLEEQFETWKGEFEQLDDVCVIGVKL